MASRRRRSSIRFEAPRSRLPYRRLRYRYATPPPNQGHRPRLRGDFLKFPAMLSRTPRWSDRASDRRSVSGQVLASTRPRPTRGRSVSPPAWLANSTHVRGFVPSLPPVAPPARPREDRRDRVGGGAACPLVLAVLAGDRAVAALAALNGLAIRGQSAPTSSGRVIRNPVLLVGLDFAVVVLTRQT